MKRPKPSNSPLTIEFLKTMFPHAKQRTIGYGEQIHWHDNEQENSITIFPRKHVAEMKRLSANMNDVRWQGNVRFSSTF